MQVQCSKEHQDAVENFGQVIINGDSSSENWDVHPSVLARIQLG